MPEAAAEGLWELGENLIGNLGLNCRYEASEARAKAWEQSTTVLWAQPVSSECNLPQVCHKQCCECDFLVRA